MRANCVWTQPKCRRNLHPVLPRGDTERAAHGHAMPSQAAEPYAKAAEVIELGGADHSNRIRVAGPKACRVAALKLDQLKSPSRSNRNDGANCQLYPTWTPPTPPGDFSSYASSLRDQDGQRRDRARSTHHVAAT